MTSPLINFLLNFFSKFDRLDTTLCLEYRPEWIAAASLHISGKLYDMKIPDVRGLPLWSEKIAPAKWDGTFLFYHLLHFDLLLLHLLGDYSSLP
jgi:hypothetical protein